MTNKKDEILMRCERTFASLERIVNILKEAQVEEIPELVKQIDIDFKHIRETINKTVMSSEG